MLQLMICQNGQDFYDRFAPALLPQEVLYQLLLRNVRSNLLTTASPTCFFGAVLDDANRPLMVFGHLAPWRLLIHALSSDAIPEGTAQIAAYICKENIAISGVLASEAICAAFLACDSAHAAG